MSETPGEHSEARTGQQHIISNEKQPRDKHKSPKHTHLTGIVATLQSIVQQLKRSNDEETPQKRSDRRWERVGILGLWAAAGVGLLAIIVASADSRKQSHLMKAQLEAMMLQQTITKAQLRANFRHDDTNVIPLGVKNEIITGTGQRIAGWMISPKWTNIGSTEARNFRGWFDIRSFDSPPLEAVTGQVCPVPSPPNPPPSEITVYPSQSFLQLAKPLSVEDVVAASKGKKVIVIYGHIEYRDIYADSPLHFEDWCFGIIPNDAQRSMFSFPALWQKTQ